MLLILTPCVRQGLVRGADTTSHRMRLFYSNLPIYSCGKSWGRGMKVWSGHWGISSHQAVNQGAGLSSHQKDDKEELGEASVELLSCRSAPAGHRGQESGRNVSCRSEDSKDRQEPIRHHCCHPSPRLTANKPERVMVVSVCVYSSLDYL